MPGAEVQGRGRFGVWQGRLSGCWRAVFLHCPHMQGLLVVVWGVSFMKVLILLTWMLPALASLFLG